MPVPNTGSERVRLIAVHRNCAARLAATYLTFVVLWPAAPVLAGEYPPETPVPTGQQPGTPAEAAIPVPKRIVSLDLCTDWILAQHADAHQVAAVSPMQPRYRPEGLQHNWAHHDGTLESIIELKPDLILAGEYNAITLRNRLKTLGFRVEVLPLPTSLDTIRSYELKTLLLLGKPASLAHPEPPDLRAAHKATALTAPTLPTAPSSLSKPQVTRPKPRLLLLGANGIGTGTQTFEHDLLTYAGWQNYLLTPGYQQLDLERMVSDPPDAVLWASTSGNALANRFSEHPALRHSLPPDRWLTTDYWRWQCPGPWTWDLIDELGQWLP